MYIDIDNIIERAVKEAVADHLEKHGLSLPATVGAYTTPDAQDEAPRYYTRQEAAAIAKISLPTLHQLHNEGRIEFVKVGRSTRIPADKFDADLSAGKFSSRNRRRA